MVINLQILGQRWKFRANIISSGIIKLKACFVAEHVTLKYIPRTSNHTWVRNNIFLFQNSSTNTIHSNDIQRSIDFSKIGKVKRGGKMENLFNSPSIERKAIAIGAIHGNRIHGNRIVGESVRSGKFAKRWKRIHPWMDAEGGEGGTDKR